MAIRSFSERTLTAEVLRRVRSAPDARLRQVMASLVRHLHGFVREVRPTPEEWSRGIRFLTETGHWCDDRRQEFILLSDTLGVSMLVDCINHGGGGAATESTLLGPFYVDGAPRLPMGSNIVGPGTPGAPCEVSGTIRNARGRPVAGARIDVWEAQGDGLYDVQKAGGLNARACFRSGPDGRYAFRCVRPVSYPVPHDGPVGKMLRATGRHPMRPGHLHFRIAAPGCETLVTHLFVRGDRYLDSDAVFGVKRSLIVEFRRNRNGEYAARYDFVLRTAAKKTSRKKP